MLAVLIGCVLRRSAISELTFEYIQQGGTAGTSWISQVRATECGRCRPGRPASTFAKLADHRRAATVQIQLPSIICFDPDYRAASNSGRTSGAHLAITSASGMVTLVRCVVRG